MSQGKKNKDRGRNAEYRVVTKAQQAGLPANRFWCSDGRSAGYSKETDCLVASYRVQVKSRTSVAHYLIEDLDSNQADVIVLEKANGRKYEHYAILKYEDWLELVNENK